MKGGNTGLIGTTGLIGATGTGAGVGTGTGNTGATLQVTRGGKGLLALQAHSAPSSPAQLLSVTDSFGRTISFGYLNNLTCGGPTGKRSRLR